MQKKKKKQIKKHNNYGQNFTAEVFMPNNDVVIIDTCTTNHSPDRGLWRGEY